MVAVDAAALRRSQCRAADLALAEVHEQAAIPYFRIDYTEDRPLKNIQSARRLPIHPELIRLGFIDYVTAIRKTGCTMLFPEMKSPGSNSFASTFYKDAWSDLVARFPDIAALKTLMTTGNASRAEFDKALEAACNVMTEQPGDAPIVPTREAGPDAEPDVIATALQTAIRDHLALRRFGIAIKAAADGAD